jgi:hypothetical protein
MPIENKKSIVTIIVAILVIVIESFYVNYMLARGLEDKAAGLAIIKAGFPLAALPAIGTFFVVLASWYHASAKLLPTKGRLDPRKRDLLVWLKIANVALLILAVFVGTLFLPYVLWSSWLWGYLGRTSSLVSLYENTAGVWKMNALWKYVVSQNLSAIFVAIVALVYAGSTSRIKKVSRKW